MLRITMNKSAAGAKKYYSEAYYNEGKFAQADYYSEKNEVIGRWGGSGAIKLGLGDEVSKKDFSLLCDNTSPATDKKLTGRNDKDRTIGYDFTFNASKSVSLAYSFANEQDKKEILNAFRQSVDETMTEIETGMQARVRDKGKNENRETGNIIYGEFTHFTTRPIDGVPDPHLHSHCFVFNATYDESDEKWKAGNFRQINQDAPYYEAFFHSKLAEKLGACGYGIDRSRNGFEIAGIEKDTLDKFSRRTREIEDYAKKNGITEDRDKARIGARTREAKRVDVDAEQEFAAWKDRLNDAEYEKLQCLKQNKGSEEGGAESVAKEAVHHALKHHLERKSVASDKEILATALKASTGKARPEEVKKQFDERQDIIPVKEGGRTFITTQGALAEEKQLITHANAMKGKFRPVNENYEPINELLNDQQQKAVKHALGTSDGVTIISGKAGTGKTTLMKEVKQGIEETGMKIHPFAPSSEASRVVQRKEGFENADTLAALFHNQQMQQNLKNQIIWVDEAGLVSNQDMNRVFKIATEQNARVILSGDIRQHNSVERGDALRIIQQYGGVRSVTVDKIQRQKSNDYRQAVKLLSEAKVEKGFKKLESIGAINEIGDSEKRIKAVAEDYCNSAFKGTKPRDVLVISPTHAEGEAVTAEIRRRMKEKGLLDDKAKAVTILKNLQYTEAEKGNIENYRAGQILVFHQNTKGVKAGAKLEITATTTSGITAKDRKGVEYSITTNEAKKFNVFESREIEIATGDKIRITGNGKAMDGKHLFNGTAYKVTGFDQKGNIRLSNGSVLPKDYGHFNLGYIMTSHASQGKTTDKIIISQSSMSLRAASMEQFYVSVSRGRQAVSIYTDDKEMLLQAVSQSAQRKSAMELAEARQMQAVKKAQELAITRNNTDKPKQRDHELSR